MLVILSRLPATVQIIMGLYIANPPIPHKRAKTGCDIEIRQ